MQDNDKYILQSVDNSLTVLELFGEYDELGVSEVAELMKIGKSTAFRILATLEHRNYLLKQNNLKYSLGMKVFSLGHVVKNRVAIRMMAHPYLQRLSKLTGETAHLVIWSDETQVVFVDKVLSSASIRMDSYVGFIMNAHLTASGKSLLSVASEDQLRYYTEHTLFERKTPNTIMSADDLLQEIAVIRQNGYAIDNEESEQGLICYAAPIVDKLGTGLAAVSISGPSHRMFEQRENCIKCVKQIAKEISQAL